MPKARKMVSLNIEETSGVDHPAHLTEGWLVIKSEDSDISNLLSDLNKQETESDISSTNEGTEEEPMPQDEATATVDTEAKVEETTEATDVEKGALADAQARIAELEKELANYKDEMDKLKGKMKKESDESVEAEEDSVLKSAPEAVQKMVADMRKAAEEASVRAQAAEEVLRKEREDRADAEAVEKAKSWSHLPIDPTKIGPALRRLALMDTDLAKSVEEMLNAVEAQAESANIFAEIGKAAGTVAGNAYEQITSIAKAAAEGGSITFEQAFTKAILDNPDLYTQYLSEKGSK